MRTSVRSRAVIAVRWCSPWRSGSQPAAAAATTPPRARRGGGDGTIASNPANGKVNLTIGSKNFTEQIVLGEIYAQALEAAGYKVKKDLNLGSETVALQGAARRGRSPAIPSTRARR